MAEYQWKVELRKSISFTIQAAPPLPLESCQLNPRFLSEREITQER
jgi:hypothetical protein